MSRLRPEHTYRQRIGKAATAMKSTIRRMIIGGTSRPLWQLFGFERADEENAPVFSGIGFYSRPRSDANAEVIIVKVGGGSEHPVIVATRDESLRKAIDAIKNMAADESAIFNSSARVHVRANGTVEIDDGSGAVALALKSDVDALKTAHDTHTHLYAPGPGSPVATAVPVPLAAPMVGTVVVKGK